MYDPESNEPLALDPYGGSQLRRPDITRQDELRDIDMAMNELAQRRRSIKSQRSPLDGATERLIEYAHANGMMEGLLLKAGKAIRQLRTDNSKLKESQDLLKEEVAELDSNCDSWRDRAVAAEDKLAKLPVKRAKPRVRITSN